MGRKISYEEKTEQLIQPFIDAHHFELVDVEYVKEGSDWYLRVYIDKEGENLMKSLTKKTIFRISIFLKSVLRGC